MIENIKTLRHFDLKRVGDDERRQAAVLRKRLEEKRRAKSKRSSEGESRMKAIKAAEAAWAKKNTQGGGAEDGASKSEQKEAADEAPPAEAVESGSGMGEVSLTSTPSSSRKSSRSEAGGGSSRRPSMGAHAGDSPDVAAKAHFKAGGGGPRPGYRVLFSSLNSASSSSGGSSSGGGRGDRVQVTEGWKGYFEIEVPIKGGDGGDRTLHVYGDGFECLEDGKQSVTASVADCTEVQVQYMNVEAVADKAGALFDRTDLKRLVLSHNAIKTFAQLRRLSAFTENEELAVSEICILPDGNPVVSLKLFRAFCAYAMPKLQSLNGQPVTQSERSQGHMAFAPLWRASAESNINTAAKLLASGGMGVSLFFSKGAATATDKQHKEIIKTAKLVEELVEKGKADAVEEEKIGLEFEKCWTGIMQNIVEGSVKDMKDEAYLERCLDALML